LISERRQGASDLATLAAGVLAGGMAVAFFPLAADDAYIVARYASNVAAGRGMVFNDGENVNALTSPFHLAALVALKPFANDVVTVYRVLSAVLVAGVLTALAWRTWGRSAMTAWFLALTLACPFLVLWAVGGMETPILICACTAMAFLSLDADKARNAAGIVALGALAVLVRYDAVLFAAPLALYAAWRHRGDTRVRATAVAGAAVVAGWIAFTLVRFGDLLPTSFYVKAARAPAVEELGNGLVYVASFVCLTWIWIAAVMKRRPGHTAQRMLWLGLALTFAYGIFASTKHMMYGYRLLVPYLPALAVALLAARSPPSRSGTLVAVLLGWQAALAAFVYHGSQNPSLALLVEGTSDVDERFEFSHLGARHTGTFLALARPQAEAIRAHWKSTGATRPPRVVVSTGGALPYHLPEAYVLEQLVSYRHRCKPPLEPLADYAQVIYAAPTAHEVARERSRTGREVVARFTLEADGLRQSPMPLAVEIWYRPNDMANPIPSTVHAPCK
jgi:hypothetical protein